MLEVNKFSAIRIHLASPDQVRSWSYGEVAKPETINYRTLKPERDGLFCERIFGPTKDWECACGKYKRVRFRGIICDKCGVEVTRSRVRRERMGHIELAAPITHIWFLKGTPSRIGQVLDITPRDLEKIVYFASFIVTELDQEARDEALGRVDRDLADRIEEIDDSAAMRLADEHRRLEEQTAQLDSQLTDELKRLDLEAQASFDSINKEAATVRNLLAAIGQRQLEDDATLSWLTEPFVAAGSVPPQDALAQLDATVEAAIAEVTARFEAEKSGARDRFTATKGVERRESDQAVARIEEDKVLEVNDARDFYEQRRKDLSTLELHQLLSEPRYQQLTHTCGDIFEAGIGAEAILDLIADVNLDELAAELREELNATSKQRQKKAAKRLKVVEAFRRSGNRPEWMILNVLPVLPPELRPMVQLDGGRFATSDLNDLYRRVINRNNRLKRLVELGAPEIIVRNEKRMLQEAVDALIDNGRRGRAVTGSSNHPYKSLSDLLRGKQGRFRQNLLGKRVDYSGRSVIVVGPHLNLNQCGLPTKMALELFKPFVMRKLVDDGHASNIKSAKRMVEHPEPLVWDALEEVTRDHPVLLNRAPTLHRLGIQAFDIVLVRGSAIQIHPLVCTAFNADFDGDQMAVHVPLSRAAQDEARHIMKSTHNILSPADGTPIVSPTKDMVLGAYYLTQSKPDTRDEDDLQAFANFTDAMLAFDHNAVDLQERIRLRVTPEDFPDEVVAQDGPAFITTTVGRIMLNQAIPRELRFVNEQLDKGGLRRVIEMVFFNTNMDVTGDVANQLKNLGMQWATRSGVTMGITDLEIPEVKRQVEQETDARVSAIRASFDDGLITDNERYRLTVKAWTDAMATVSSSVETSLDPMSPVFMMGNSGAAKGNFDQIRQISGMRGLMSNPAGRIIEMPVRANFREGMSAHEYFISTHGGRKGLADTALRTADSGYLTRRLVDVAQDVIVMGDDCGTLDGIPVEVGTLDEVLDSVGVRCFGRFPARPIVHPATGEIIVPLGTLIDHDLVKLVDDAGVQSVTVRSPMTCANARGLCQMCYGMDLARHELVAEGAAVGIIAAQSMGEPATQLTMRTFHLGGIATVGADIVDKEQGLPRVQELFEARIPKGVAVMSDIDGTVEVIEEDEQRRVRVVSAHVHEYEYPLDPGMVPIVEDGADIARNGVLAVPKVQADDLLARKAKSKSNTISKRALAKVAGIGVTAEADGVVEIHEGRIVVRAEEEDVSEYPVSLAAELRVQSGEFVREGDQLTEGPLNPHDILRLRGRAQLQQYIVSEVQRVYRMVGVAVNDKHIEIIIRQMLRHNAVDTPGETSLLPGTLVDRSTLTQTNVQVAETGGQVADSHEVLLGVTKASLNNESFLAAASFQDTTRVLTEAVVEGKTDHLHGLKENVIIGKLIPAGTGWDRYHGPALEAPGQSDVLIDTEAMHMAEGVTLDDLRDPDNGADATPDLDNGAQAGVVAAGVPPMDAAESDLLAGIETSPSGASDEFADFLRPSEDFGIDESSAVRSDPAADGEGVDDGGSR
ncbi:MAG: DNA-directed RNA polymerase subunit beta' [Chloroflexota bacterium]|nr:DNA-directed RNA polymerase subunit beta' [Chloroflexota bacterium]MDE2918564.1 DNA-directed RNA polymerase subunit beta' [Chloroflexota bacterium]